VTGLTISGKTEDFDLTEKIFMGAPPPPVTGLTHVWGLRISANIRLGNCGRWRA
jgi:hypothetical protein